MAHRVGIIGFGKMGRIRAEALRKDGRAEIAVVYDIETPTDTEYRVAPSIEAIVNDPEVDIAVVCLPNFLNRQTTIAALKAGKHVFCEKPPAFNAAEVREIMAAEAESDKVLMYGFNHRHHAGVDKLKRIVDSGAYGRVLWMRGRYGKSVDGDYLKTWRADRAMAGGGILMDQGIHMLDLFQYIGGTDFDQINAFVSSHYWNIPGIEDNVFAIMRDSKSGVEVSFHSTMTQWRHLFSLEVFTERGYLVLNGLKTSSGTYGEEVLTIAKNRTVAPAASFADEEKLTYEVDTSWDKEAEHFMDAVSLGLPVKLGTSQQALEVMTLIDRIYANDHAVGKVLHSELRRVGQA